MDYLIKDETLQGIANAVREKANITDGIKVSEMEDAIRNMHPEWAHFEKDVTYSTKTTTTQVLISSSEIETKLKRKFNHSTDDYIVSIGLTSSTASTKHVVGVFKSSVQYHNTSSATINGMITYHNMSSASTSSVTVNATSFVGSNTDGDLVLAATTTYGLYGTYKVRLWIKQ